jgi:hypothetical protein
MKVRFKNLLMGYTGMADDSVIYFSPKRGRYIIRRRPKYTEGEHNRIFAQINRRIFALQPSEAYKQDLREYLKRYNALPINREHPVLGWNLIYSKMMWNMHALDQVDLSSISRDQLPDLACRKVSLAVASGLLPMVPDYQDFQAEF